jgi:3-hydroxyisobutyrate dehydrogenase-like beta-hydroxyacid dehydrogenase
MNQSLNTDQPNLGILHPGEMGISIAASAQNSGYKVHWASKGRSPETIARAERQGLLDAHSLAHLCQTCTVIFSVCPPGEAETVANSVLAEGFSGLYIDMNAISPQRAERIGAAMAARGVRFVDGGIIGGPAWKPNSTWLYLSGEEAETAASYFSAGPLVTCVIGDSIGKASALKMCFAAYTKGTTALLGAVLAASEALNVRKELEQQWSKDDPNAATQNARRVQNSTAKAWRFVGEMEEIAATFRAVGVPGEFHSAAGEVYQRMADFKGAPGLPSLEAVLAALLQKSENSSANADH